jgi:membrane-associated phospholipid phosphatase
MIAALGVAISIVGVVTGLAWRLPAVGSVDRHLFSGINHWRTRHWLDGFLGVIRLLGTHWALLAVFVWVVAWRPVAGLSLVIAAGISASLERALKVGVARQRPFELMPDVQLRQVPPPSDPSFPSGDASRAWFLATALSLGMEIPPLAACLAFLLALLVAAARVRAGVHYPSDVWAGSWLGSGIGLVWVGLLPFLPAIRF